MVTFSKSFHLTVYTAKMYDRWQCWVYVLGPLKLGSFYYLLTCMFVNIFSHDVGDLFSVLPDPFYYLHIPRGLRSWWLLLTLQKRLTNSFFSSSRHCLFHLHNYHHNINNNSWGLPSWTTTVGDYHHHSLSNNSWRLHRGKIDLLDVILDILTFPPQN